MMEIEGSIDNLPMNIKTQIVTPRSPEGAKKVKEPPAGCENIFGREGAGNAINSSGGMSVLTENSSSFGSRYVDNASFCRI